MVLGAHVVRAARWRGLWQPGRAGQGAAPLASRAGLRAALAQAVQASGAKAGMPVHAVLSSAWVRLQLAQQASQLGGRSELDAAARHALQRVYGDITPAWCVRADRCGHDGLLCAAVEQTLLDELAGAASAVGLRLVACSSQVVSAWNRVQQRLPENGWLVVLEGGRGTLVCIEQRQARVLQSHRVGTVDQAGDQALDPAADLGPQLALWRQRCRLQEAAGDPEAPCVVVACDWPTAVVAGARVVHLSGLD